MSKKISTGTCLMWFFLFPILIPYHVIKIIVKAIIKHRSPPSKPEYHESNEDYYEFEGEFDYWDDEEVDIEVVGVIYSDNGKERQEVLRKIKKKESPFDKPFKVGLKEYLYKGKTAFYVMAGEEIIGVIPSEDVPHVKKRFSKITDITLSIRGGGTKKSGEKNIYKANISLKLDNK